VGGSESAGLGSPHRVIQRRACNFGLGRRKRYQSRPRLCRSDGEIMAFRDYCAQFYADQR